MIIAIVQARMSSSRCPGKVLMPILGKPMIWHQWQRMKHAKCIDNIILATSTHSSDDELAQYFLDQGETVFRGSLDDVLGRYFHCASVYQPTHVVRLTADCPLIDPDIIDLTIKEHIKNENEYTTNYLYPVGLSVEVMKMETLTVAHHEAKLCSQREHVTLYLYQHPEKFKLGKVICEQDLSHYRLTVDYKEDLALVRLIYEALYLNNPNFDTYTILDFLKKNPELTELNSHIKNNEGLIKSLQNDKLMIVDN